MQFGIFLPNGSDGYILSEATPTYEPSFEHNLAIAQEAEKYDFDFLISMIKFQGFGGSTKYWDGCLESFTLTAGLAAATKKIRFFASSGIPSLHPALAARMMATLDNISGGRVGLNIVTGWNRPEYDSMGLWPSETYHAERYDYAEEYIDVVRKLWSQASTDHESKHFSLKGATCLPKPQSEISICCAGQSPKGIELTAKHGDFNFVHAPAHRLKKMTDAANEAAARHGRKIGTLACFTLIAAPTDEEAAEKVKQIIDQADHAGIANMIASASQDTNKGGTSDNMKEALKQPAEEGNMAFMSIPVIAGSYETCARLIDEIASDSGVTGILWTFPDFVPGITEFGEKIKPLLKCVR